MRINIIGAAGSGTSTLGAALALQLDVPFFDRDDFYWIDTPVPFIKKRDAGDRDRLLNDQLHACSAWVLSGPVINWAVDVGIFDLVVFLYIPPHTRIQRLQKREEERYGELLITDNFRRRSHREFMELAAAYDHSTAPGTRNLVVQRRWLEKLTCPVLEINSDKPVNEHINTILKTIASI